MAKTETLSPATVSRSWLPRLDGGTALMDTPERSNQEPVNKLLKEIIKK